MEHLQLQDSDDNEDSLDFSLTAQAKITKRSKFARKSLSKVRNNLNAHPRKISPYFLPPHTLCFEFGSNYIVLFATIILSPGDNNVYSEMM